MIYKQLLSGLINELLSEKFRRLLYDLMLTYPDYGLPTQYLVFSYPYQEVGAQGLWNEEFLQLIAI